MPPPDGKGGSKGGGVTFATTGYADGVVSGTIEQQRGDLTIQILDSGGAVVPSASVPTTYAAISGGGYTWTATFASEPDLAAGNYSVVASYDETHKSGRTKTTTSSSHDFEVEGTANATPTANDDAFAVDEDGALSTGNVLDNDTDADVDDTLTASLVSGPTDGVLVLNEDGTITYTPDTDFNGTDSFTYTASDGTASDTATVTITVNPVNDAPTAAGDSYDTPHDTPLTVAAPGVLANDADVDGDALTAVLVDEPVKGTLTLNADGSFNYTPNAGSSGTDSFTYRAHDGTVGGNEVTVSINVAAGDGGGDGSGDASSPIDPLYLSGEQWHLSALGGSYAETSGWTDYSAIEKIWAEYTGVGVLVGIYDNGIEYTHPDLAPNYLASAHLYWNGTLDPYPTSSSEAHHGTAVAGVIGAADNDLGTVGIAYGAMLTGVNIFSGAADINSPTPEGFKYAAGELYRFDVSNHSWGGLPTYMNDTNEATLAFIAGAQKAAELGREGLGSIVLKAAGNWADSAQGDAGDTTRHTVTVTAHDSDGDASWYTSRGANVLVSAPSSGNTIRYSDGTLTPDSDLRIATTDREGSEGYAPGAWSSSENTTGFGGTSSATPAVAGVVALMLDANPTLGWRDVQNILAVSAREAGSPTGGAPNSETEIVPIDADTNGSFESTGPQPIEWYPGQWNGADDWNGGGHHVSMAYGHGAVDVDSAVRMAEAWSLFDAPQTSANEYGDSTGVMTPNLSVSGDGSTDSQSFEVSGVDLDLEYVDISIALNTKLMQEVKLELISPSGTVATLLDIPLNDYTPAYTFFGAFLTRVDVTWTFGAHMFKGEDPNGTWTVRLTEEDVAFDDKYGGVSGNTLSELTLDFHGGAASDDDVYHYTDEMITLDLNAEPDRVTLEDSGGNDWLNLAAMSDDLDVDLDSGVTASTASGSEPIATFAAGTIENAVTGDGADLLVGNGVANQLYGMRGDDEIHGGGGGDELAGGQGTDDLWGDAGPDVFRFEVGDGADTFHDFADGEDMVELVGYDASDLKFLALTAGTELDLGGGDSILFAGVAENLSAEDFLFSTV